MEIKLPHRFVLLNRRFDVASVDVPRRSGGVEERLVVVHSGGVVIVPVMDDGRIILISNERHFINRTLLELPAGKLEEGEAPETAAGRELLEETGFTAERIDFLFRYFVSPGSTTQQMHFFLARGLSEVGQDLDDTERIETRMVSPAEAKALLDSGAIEDAKTIAGLLWYFRKSRV